jgi:transcriptional regulator with XRE-family HTH domain
LTGLSMLLYTRGMAKHTDDPAMERVRELFEQSKLTLDELGARMGYQGETARASAWQFVRRTKDPRLSMLRRFAAAVGVSMRDLFPE